MKRSKRLRYFIEACLLYTAFAIFRILSVDWASGFGGWIGRVLGPRLKASRHTLENLRLALPHLDATQRETVLREMWDNLGRVIAEYPHLQYIARHRTTIEDISIFHRLRDDNRPGIVIGAHMANWEVAGTAAFEQCGLTLDLIYRAPNNPTVDRMLKRLRTSHLPGLRTMTKSKSGARGMVQSLRDKRHVAILVDQKFNEGIPALFFGRPAMTSPAYVHLAQKFACPLILARFERTKGANFRISARDMPYNDAAGNPLPAETVIAETHAWLERWIIERPGQWLWLHNRWSGRAEWPQ